MQVSTVFRKFATTVFLIFMLLSAFSHVNSKEPLLVFAASSLKDAIEELSERFEIQFGEQVLVSFAASSTLARQIENGAPADLFISADQEWMDYLSRENAIQKRTRTVVAANSLAIIGSEEMPENLDLSNPSNFVDLLGSENFTMADPIHVPAGRYGKAALESLGIWSSVANQLIPAEHTRVALAFVSRGEVLMGIVYASDALSDSNVKVLAGIPQTSHPAIRYPAAATNIGDTSLANRFIEFLKSGESQSVFRKHGFGTIR